MKHFYVPLEKRSKREQREHYAARRGSWGGVNPVTRKPPNPKAYKRKKSGQRNEYESLPGFCFIRKLVVDKPASGNVSSRTLLFLALDMPQNCADIIKPFQ